MRRIRTQLLGIAIFLAAAAAPPAAGQEIDWTIIAADLTDAGPGLLDLGVVFHLGAVDVQEGAEFASAVSILFNGLPLEPAHTVTVISQTAGPACLLASPCINNPSNPCNVLKYTYKMPDPGVVNGRCLKSAQTHTCVCHTGPPPFFHKSLPRPLQPGLITITIDPDNLVPETDETNNVREIPFDPAVGCGQEDTFDVYADGSQLHGQGGWKGWDDNPAFSAPVTAAQVHSGTQSVDISGAADLVHEYCESAGGWWSHSAWQYIPEGYVSPPAAPLTGSGYILLNTYNDGGPYHWSVQVRFDSTDGMLKAMHGAGIDEIAMPYQGDRWVRLQAIIDLDEDWTRVYYDDNLVAEYPWTGGILGGGGGALDVAAADLFGNASSSIYYDDIRLEPIIGCGETLEGDADEDGLPLVDEFRIGTDSCNADTDNDGLLDGADNCPLDPEPDGCVKPTPCPADLDGDWVVGITDFLAVLAAWGTSPGGPPDFDGGGVGITDFLFLLEHWGPCP